MTYELNETLLKAGYPMVVVHPGVRAYGAVQLYTGLWYQPPTLSELIEACRQDDRHIELYQKHTSAICNKESTYWTAFLCYARGAREMIEQGSGNIPEEAVAKLWLALQRIK